MKVDRRDINASRRTSNGRDARSSMDASKSRVVRKVGASTAAGMIAGRDADGTRNISRCKDTSNSNHVNL